MTVYIAGAPTGVPGNFTAGGNLIGAQIVSNQNVWLWQGDMILAEYPSQLTPLSTTLWFISGAPVVGMGNNNDFAMRVDGTEAAHTLMYHKEGGAWVAMAS